MKHTHLVYLLLNVFTILVPLIRSFEPKIYFAGKWKSIALSIGITGIFFLTWDYFKTLHGVWSFNNEYLLGPRFGGLPLEEYLFFISVPYACLFIYETLTYYQVSGILSKHLKQHVYVLGILLGIGSFFFTDKAYTWSVMVIAPPVLWLNARFQQAVVLERMLLTYLISIIPMALVNGLLTGLPVVWYNNEENCGLRAVTIPIEDYLYNLILLGMVIGLYRYFSQRYAPSARPFISGRVSDRPYSGSNPPSSVA